MKIAQIVPIWESVPPPLYGGTQRIASQITEGLVQRGHDVTLFATGDSQTKANLVSYVDKPLYRSGISWENHLYPALHYYNAFQQADNFDVIHCHIDRHTEYFAFMLASYCKKPVVFTLHFMLPDTPDREDRKRFLHTFKDLNYISISNSQKSPMPELNFLATVYNGVDTDEIQFYPEAGDSLIWLGRLSQTKGAKEAIEIAKKSGHNLILAGKLDELNSSDLSYFKKEVEPLIDGKQIQYIGEVNSQKRNELFSKAVALLNPIQWPEPFGLVPVEAMAAGIPVVANARGAMPELIKDNETGFLVESVDGAVEALKKISNIKRENCRKHVENNFSISRMVDGYEAAYDKVTN